MMLAGNNKKNTVKTRSRGAQSTTTKQCATGKATSSNGQQKRHTKVGGMKS